MKIQFTKDKNKYNSWTVKMSGMTLGKIESIQNGLALNAEHSQVADDILAAYSRALGEAKVSNPSDF